MSTNTSIFFSPNPRKRAVERLWLLYTPVWGSVSGIVMFGGFGERWGDFGLLVFGTLLGLGAAILPVVLRAPEDRDVPWFRSTAFTMVASVVLIAFGLNYTQTPFFWDVLHMHYGFASTTVIDDNPVFLYFLTIAYFATYSVLTCMALRGIKHVLVARPRTAALIGFSVAPFAMAFLETALNANPFMESLFCYDDMGLMLWFGTLSYGVAFVYALPMWFYADEEPGKRVGVATVVVWGLAALYADLITLDVLRHHVAPLVTVVENDAHNLRDFGDGCLESPGGD
jgi:cycloeucalenol cycloisomerase